jgi:hypothetical protein
VKEVEGEEVEEGKGKVWLKLDKEFLTKIRFFLFGMRGSWIDDNEEDADASIPTRPPATALELKLALSKSKSDKEGISDDC